MDLLDPRVELVLRLRDVALVGRLDAGVRDAQRHRALGERPVDRVLRRRAELDPLVADAAHDAALDHRIEHAAAGRVAHAMMQIRARADFLDGGEVATLVMDAGQPVARELLRDVRDPVALALGALFGSERRPLANAVEDAAGTIGDAPIELPTGVAIERAAWRIRRVLRDLGELERLAVVERCVTATMPNGDRMFGRYLIQVTDGERTLVLELRVVVEIALDPC